MCDFSRKLVAWMDGELPEGEAVPVEEHLKECAECRGRLASYRRLSEAFVAYCEAGTSAEAVVRAHSGVPAWALAAMGAASAAALLLALLPKPVVQSPAQAERPLTAHASAGGSLAPSAAAPVSRRAARNPASARRSRWEQLAANTVDLSNESVRATEPMPTGPAASLNSQPAIEIAIPSDAVFPPGAMPEGVSFVADVTLGADGTAERLRLQPTMVRFERRAIRP